MNTTDPIPLGGDLWLEPALPEELSLMFEREAEEIQSAAFLMNGVQILGAVLTWRSRYEYWRRAENHMN